LAPEDLPTAFFEELGFGADYGTSCANWDADKSWCEDADDEFCKPFYTWCYVDPACDDSEEVDYLKRTEYAGKFNSRQCTLEDEEHDCVIDE
jgi:hypothetical protein